MTATRTLRELVDQGKAKLAPTQATDEELKEVDREAKPITVISVDYKAAKDDLYIWEMHFTTAKGKALTVGLWPNPQRDDTMSSLMQLCQDGPVGGVRLFNAGTDKKPFWLVGAA